MASTITVSCLPVAGKENPYQLLMMKGLSDAGLSVRHGHPSRFTGIFFTAMQRPDFIHFDWETAYYQRRSLWMTLINIPFFIIQVLMAKYIFGCTLVWTPHNVTPHDQQYPQIHRFCRRFFAAQVSWIRVFSATTIERISAELNIPTTKCRVVPEGSYVGYYKNDTTRIAARKKLGIADEGRVLLYLGYIKPYKGITELIKAFHHAFHDDTQLLIAGQVMDKDYFTDIKSIAGNRILLENRFIADDELQYYMHAADAVVLPFKKIENSGSVILAMGFEKPVIAPRMGVVTERLSEQTALLYSHQLDEAFEQFKLLNSSALQQIGKRNTLALEKYRWTDFAKEFTLTC